MNWATVSIQRLKDYEIRKQAAENITEQIELLQERFTAIRSATTDGTPTPTNANRREEMLAYNVTMREELTRNLAFAKREISLTEKGLAALTDKEKRILNLFFINRTRNHIQQLCDELYISKTELYRLKDEALRKFTIAMYGIVDI